jgi:predicted porin
MWRGHKASRLTILSAILGLVGCFQPARASDDVAKCCAELDSRLEELASAVLGDAARNVKVQIYGQVNRAILFWKDGIDSKTSLVDNNTSSTRLGLIGDGTIRPGLTVGSRFEMEFVWPSSSEIFDPENVTHNEALTGYTVRQAYGFINDERLGTLTYGYQWSASGNLTIVNLGSEMNDAALHYNNAFSLGLKLSGSIFTDLKWGQLAESVDVLRGEYLRRLHFSGSCSRRPLA